VVGGFETEKAVRVSIFDPRRRCCPTFLPFHNVLTSFPRTFSSVSVCVQTLLREPSPSIRSSFTPSLNPSALRGPALGGVSDLDVPVLEVSVLGLKPLVSSVFLFNPHGQPCVGRGLNFIRSRGPDRSQLFFFRRLPAYQPG